MSEFEKLVMDRLDHIELLILQNKQSVTPVKYLTLGEVEVLTGFGRKTINKYMESQLLKYSRFANGHYRFAKADVDAFMTSISNKPIKKA